MTAVLAVLRRRWVDVVVLSVLVLLALVPLLPVFATVRLVVAVLLGVLAGAGLAVVGAARRWGALAVLAALLIAFVLLAGLAAPETALGGVLPTPTTIGAVGSAVVTAWKQIVTLAPPLGAGGAMLTAPYVLALGGTLTAVTIALRARRPVWALLVPAGVLAGAILLGTAEPVLAVPLAILGAVAALAWGTWRTGRMRAGRPLGVGVLMVVAALGATGVGLLAPPQTDRLVLREHIEPPFDPHAYPSPLVEFRHYTKDVPEETLLTVTGMPEGTPVRLAVLDTYDGTVWSVGSPTEPGTGAFVRIGERVEPELAEGLLGAEIEIGAYDGVWLPHVGRTYDVELAGARTELYFNRTTGTGVVTSGLSAGDTYQVLFEVPPTPSASALEGAQLADVDLPPAAWPDLAPAIAAQMTADASAPLARVLAIEGALQDGYFSHGLEGDYPSRPGHGAERLAVLLEEQPMVGDAEQYAAAMALLLRSLDMPARVVMGFEADGSADGEVTGEDVTAWVEVAFEGHGWVPFSPTPEEDRIPQDESETPQDRPQPQVLQPPPPPQEPPDAPPSDRQDVDVEDEELEEDEGTSLVVVAVVTIPLLLLLAPFLLVLALKARRRRRRRNRGTPARRVAGGWSELTDTATDLGIELTPRATRSQTAAELSAALATHPGARGGPGSTGAPALLARQADAGTFGPTAPADEDVAAYWSAVESGLQDLRSTVGRRRWWRARVSARSLRRRTAPGRPREKEVPNGADQAHPAPDLRRAGRPHGDRRQRRHGR